MCGPQEAEFQMKVLANETRFILAVVSGELVVSNRKKADIVADLERAGYDKMPPKKKVHKHAPQLLAVPFHMLLLMTASHPLCVERSSRCTEP